MGTNQDRVLEAFRQRFRYDRGLRRLKPVADYQRMFRGFDEAIALEYARLESERAGDGPVEGPRAGSAHPEHAAPCDAHAAATNGAPEAETDDAAESRTTGTPGRADAVPAANRVGPYVLLRELGRGGQAVVHLAEDTRLPRKVALKVFTSGLHASEQFLARFRREAEAASRLDHPGICTIHEAGLDGATPYIAMRYVEGRTLAEWIASTTGGAAAPRRTSSVDLPAPTGARASPNLGRLVGLVEKVARALHAAHEAGLIHRDVKPGNIIVTREGEPVVLDFGLAREDEEGHTLTATGALLGTPAYMSPEQIVGERGRVDRRTDVYSLGVTLYECLTLRLPFTAPTREGLFHQILRSDPDPPRRSSPSVPRDLEVVLLTAMQKSADRRYQTALDFAEDLRRFREHEPIRARPTPPVVRLGRWMQRHPATATGVVAAFALLASGLGITTHYLRQVTEEQTRTKSALTRARVEGLAAASSEALATDPMRALLLAREAVRAEAGATTVSALHRALVACLERAELRGHDGRLRFVCFSPSGDRIVTTSWDSTARVWDPDGRELAVLRGHERPVVCAAFSPSGDRILTASDDGTARSWDLLGKEPVVLRGHVASVVDAHFSAAGDRIVTASGDGTARMWDRSGHEIVVLRGHEGPVNAAQFTPASDRVLTASNDGTARVWDLSGTTLAVCRGHTALINDLAVSPSGDRFVTASFDGTARLWDIEGNEVAVFRGHRAEVIRVAFSPAGDRIATVGNDWTVRVWDLAGNEVAKLDHHDGHVERASFSPSGDRIVTASFDTTARVWDLSGRELAALRGHGGWVVCAAFSPSGDRVVTASHDRTARVWELAGREAARLHWGELVSAALSPAGDRVATASSDGTARIRDLDGKAPVVLRGHRGPVTSASWSPSGDRIVTSSSDLTARVWDLAGTQLLETPALAGGGICAEFSPAGDRIVTGDFEAARVFDLSGTQLAEMRGHASWIVGASFSPSGDRVLTASYDGTAALWDLSGTRLVVLRGHEQHVNSARFSRSGDRIVTAADDRTACVWDLDGNRLAVLHGHTNVVWSAAFSPAGDRVVTASEDKTVRLWDLGGNELALLRGHDKAVRIATFVPSGDRIVTASRDGTALVWFVRTDDLLRFSDTRITRDLSAVERALYAEFLGGAK